jgi:hypothetical protein
MDSNSDSPDRQALFDEVLLYVLDKTSGKLDISPPVVRKLLQFVDRDWHEAHGEYLLRSACGSRYFGPTTKEFTLTLHRMLAEGTVRREQRWVERKTLVYKVYPVRKPNLALVPPDVLKVVDGVLARIAGV